MNFALGLVLLSLVGGDGSPGSERCDSAGRKVTVMSLAGAEDCPGRQGPSISYDVRVLQIHGLDWRRKFFALLQPVASQGGGSVWTITGDTVDRLAKLDPSALQAPTITAAPGALAHLTDRANRRVASGLTRVADGPFDHATRVAYAPSYAEVREGLALTMTGRKLDQGVLACVIVDDTRVAAVHQVALTENVAARDGDDDGVLSNLVSSRIEVPEIGHASLAGEWLIPNDGALLVSLGVQTAADADGKATVVERLVLIEATVEDHEPTQPAETTSYLDLLDAWKKGPAAAGSASKGTPMPMPAMPSRSLPEALDADGAPLALPPLPDDLVTPSSLPGSSAPCASPQGSQRRLEKDRSTDPASTQTGFNVPGGGAGSGAGAARPGAPYLLRFPIKAGGMNLEVEIRMDGTLPLVPTTPGQETANYAK